MALASEPPPPSPPHTRPALVDGDAPAVELLTLINSRALTVEEIGYVARQLDDGKDALRAHAIRAL